MSGEKKNFWMTLNLLVGAEWKKNLIEDVQDWLESIEAKKEEANSDIKTASSASAGASKSSKSSGCGNKKKIVVQLPKVECSFRHPKIRSRLERLMGSNLVRLTDRKYMLKLTERVFEDYLTSMNKRIAAREAQERERQKELVLHGLMPLNRAPKEMANHPVLLINKYCETLIAQRRALIKVPQVVVPLVLFLDDTPDPPPGLSIIEGHVFRKAENLICIPPQNHLACSKEEDIESGYMFTKQEYVKKQKYESPNVQKLEFVKTVEEMYSLADEIIGPLKTMKDSIVAVN